MPASRFPALLAFTITTFAISALAVHTRLVCAPFNSTAYNELINCVRNVSTNYAIAIDAGQIVIIPPEGESIDFDGADILLGRCLARVCSVLNVAVGSDSGSVPDDVPTQTLEHANAEWAEANGAEGLQGLIVPDMVYGRMTGHSADGEYSMSARREEPADG